MKILSRACFVVCLLSVSSSLFAQGFLKAEGQRIVNAQGENVLLRGIGLGGWMLQEGYMLGLKDSGQQHVIRQRLERILSKAQVDEFYEVWLNNHTTKADIDSLKAWGFNSVRLPIHYNLFTLAAEQEPVAGNNTWLPKGFALTDSLLSWCKANGMYLILDMHAAPGGQGNDVNISDRDPSKPTLWQNEASRQKLIALWKQLATRYAGEPWIGAYDIINEPNYGFSDPNDRNGINEKNNRPLKELLIDITKAIRTVDNNHLIIIEGNAWGNNYKGILDEGLWDKNMALSFHKYWNFNDDASIKQMLEYRTKLNVPVWLGESGENSNVWYTQAISLLEKNNIGWAWWPLKKLGANNPLQIRSNHNYDKLIAYLNGHSKNAPGESDTYSGLLEMATYSNIKSNIIHYDVIDAMMRQPHERTAKPFKNNLIKNNTKINAVDYDLGSNGVAYYDTDTANYWVSGNRSAGNRGGVYRNDGVDIYADSSNFDSYYVGNIEAGEWLQYTVNVAVQATYQLSFKLAAEKPGTVITLTDNGKEVKRVEVSSTRGVWNDIVVGDIALIKGLHVLRIKFVDEGLNFSQLEFLKK